MVKVLIAEDEDIIRKMLVQTIDWLRMGCVVAAETASGSQGVELIRELQPELVITDISMPGMDGLEMIRRGQEFADFESIVLTSYSRFDYAKQAIGAGVAAYILKPIDEDILEQEVRKACRTLEKKQEYRRMKLEQNMDKLNAARREDLTAYQKACRDYYVRLAIQRIISRYPERISVKTIAEELGVSASYLSRRFKSETSETFGVILNRHRISKSIELLESSPLRLYEIAEAVGFTDYKHFCNVFKRYTDLTPSDYQRMRGDLFRKQPEGREENQEDKKWK
ncbi:MAG: response regulator [Lawsonibacter sp.]|nr:response regulator [Lawsonibacter sp.]